MDGYHKLMELTRPKNIYWWLTGLFALMLDAVAHIVIWITKGNC